MKAQPRRAIIEVLGRDGAQLHREVASGLHCGELFALAQRRADEHNGTAVILWNVGGSWTICGNYGPARRAKVAPVEVIEEVTV